MTQWFVLHDAVATQLKTTCFLQVVRGEFYLFWSFEIYYDYWFLDGTTACEKPLFRGRFCF